MKKSTEKTKEAIAQSDAGDAPDGVTDRAIEAGRKSQRRLPTKALRRPQTEASWKARRTPRVSRALIEGEPLRFRGRVSRHAQIDAGQQAARYEAGGARASHAARDGLSGYRCDWGKAPGRPDVAFVGRKLAIEIRGCFWHRCPTCSLSVPKKNLDYWEARDSPATSSATSKTWRR